VKAIFRDPRALDAALGYYRALSPRPPKSYREKITVPTVCFAGESDIVAQSAYDRAARCFAGPYEVVRMKGGHFMHREYPDVFHRELLRVLARAR
jgi:pimeloyl-ACP methyl ester carboxylesterase